MGKAKFPNFEVLEEERRLAFVAMTRAEKRLCLSEAEGRNIDGSPRYPSRFVLDIDPGLLEYTQPPRDGLIAEAREYVELSEKYLPENLQQDTFAVGERVRHEYLGEGTVVDVDMEKDAHIVQFDSMSTAFDILPGQTHKGRMTGNYRKA